MLLSNSVELMPNNTMSHNCVWSTIGSRLFEVLDAVEYGKAKYDMIEVPVYMPQDLDLGRQVGSNGRMECRGGNSIASATLAIHFITMQLD